MAVSVFVPIGRDEVVSVAVPLLSAEVPSRFVPSKKLMDPVAVGLETVAVSVTGELSAGAALDAVSNVVTVVGAGSSLVLPPLQPTVKAAVRARIRTRTRLAERLRVPVRHTPPTMITAR